MRKEYKIDGVPLYDIQEKLCEIMDEFDFICRKHGIKYSIEGGTLLGAVKYGGFVPWDDDIDIVMLRSQYNKFIEACKTDLSDKFFLQTSYTDSEFPLNYAKLRYNNTVYRQWNYSGLKIHHGLFIDIFPLDDVRMKEYKSRIHILGLLNGAKVKKLGIRTKKAHLLKDAFYAAISVFPLVFLNKAIEKTMEKPIKNAKYVYPLYNPIRGLLPQSKSIFSEYTDIEFAGRQWMAIKEYEIILKDAFGDYMNEEPDPETRGPSHAIVECKIGAPKRVGIITFHQADNYGAVLQSYALARAIELLGKREGTSVACDIIDYCNESIANRYKLRELHDIPHIKTKIKHILTVKHKRRNHELFCRFREVFLPLSPRKYNKENIAEVNAEYNVVISGSDQVFNGLLTADDPEYFLRFASDNIQKVTYAASIGAESQVRDKPELFKWLYRMDAISVRENEARTALSENGYGWQPVVIDPTLLLDRSEYEKLLPRIQKKRKRYILLYVIAAENRVYEFAKKLAKIKRCQIVYINADQLTRFGIYNERDVSVPSFLELIKNAECVVTSSFHGVAFSLIFQVPFYYQLSNAENNFNSRIKTLVQMAGVEDRIIPVGNVTDEIPIDWTMVEKRILGKKYEAERYLLDNVINTHRDMKG